MSLTNEYLLFGHPVPQIVLTMTPKSPGFEPVGVIKTSAPEMRNLPQLAPTNTNNYVLTLPHFAND